ncbi:MAG: bifunctional glutamate N-acetyltransferase/amino-acid acetyltransferase ArgJ [Gammaproteobacteria bacterium]|nr:bifunctional glutamate N-acetyltransferase/amino-acid acetyltransferase ArgJ [Gammaproteobacteria bacterium]
MEKTIINGIKIATAAAGIKKVNHEDLTLFAIEAGSTMAGVFTQNAFCAAPVNICKQHLQQFCSEKPFYLLINTGNANAGTGEQGYQDAINCCSNLAKEMDTTIEQIFPYSTGVIGENLPSHKIISSLSNLKNNLAEDNWDKAAKAILTTDTVTKSAHKTIQLSERQIEITGISKGSGMIRPDMATMLAYIATDLAITKDDINQIIVKMANASFNRITVDGDTSTNDSCMLIATGKSELTYENLSVEDKSLFEQSLQEVFVDLAKAIILDGEGATKLINIVVHQGQSQQECLDVAYTIAHSPLVKTAFFASDPNWGRILAAIGRSGINNLDLNALEVFLDDVCIVNHGGKSDDYQEAKGQAVMNKDEITVTVNLHRGEFSEQLWTCDFSYDYVKINAEYRT